MLTNLVKMQPDLIKMAKSFCIKTHEDILQDTYIKLHDCKKTFEEIDTGYIYIVMRSVFINSIRKEKGKVLIDDFSKFELYEIEVKQDTKINTDNLNPFEKALLIAHYGKKIVTKDNIIIGEIKPASLLKLSKETNISYRTLYTTLQKIKKKLCKDLVMQ